MHLIKKSFSIIRSTFKLITCIFITNPIYYVSGFFRRNSNIWIIGSKNTFTDNSKYFYILYTSYLKNKHAVDLIWISRSKKTVREINRLNIGKCYYAYSIQGLFALLSAKVYIYSYEWAIDLPFIFSRKTIRVYLWHGIGLKKIFFLDDNPKVQRKIHSKLLKYIYPAVFVRPNIMLATSVHTAKYFSECFSIDIKKCVISLYPRCTILYYEKDKLFNFIEKYEAQETKQIVSSFINYKKVILYMPTWRDSDKNFLNNLKCDWSEINDCLTQKGILLLIKAHPNTQHLKLNRASNLNIVQLNSKIDIYPILPFTDALITDYSSIYFDYLHFPEKEIFLFPFDYDYYIKNCRGFAYDYTKHMPGPRIYDFSRFFKSLEVKNMPNLKYAEERKEIFKIYWKESSKPCDMVSEIIKQAR